MQGYKDLLLPDKVGGTFFTRTMYPRYFILDIEYAIFAVIFIKLQGQTLSLQEIVILGQAATLCVFLVPALGHLRIPTLTLLSTLCELFALSLMGAYTFGLISTKVFLYTLTLDTVFKTLVYGNLSAVMSGYVQKKTNPDTAEYRSRGYQFVSALGAVTGSIIMVITATITDNIQAALSLLLCFTLVSTITVAYTNIKIKEYCQKEQ